MQLPKQDPDIDVSVLLPARGRPEPLLESLRSLIDTATKPERIEVLIAFDNDDVDTINYCTANILPYLDSKKCKFTVVKFERLGYIRLNEYLNHLTKYSHGSWFFFWNDDAVMTTYAWDTVIRENSKEFALLRAETNHEHPYAIFPILPRKWVEVTGHLSPHQINDAWTSQVAWMLDIVKTVPIYIEHERYDLTGKNNDEVFKNRPMLEGNPNHPRDFNHESWRFRRIDEAFKLADYIEKTENRILQHFRDSMQGKVNVWHKMLALDKKGLIKQWKINDQQ